MERAYSILMFCFAGMILLYAALLAPGNVELIPRRWAVPIKDRKDYAKRFAKLLALLSLSPLSSGIVAALIDINRHPAPAVVTLIVMFAVCLRRGVRMMEEAPKPRETPDGTSSKSAADENNSRP